MVRAICGPSSIDALAHPADEPPHHESHRDAADRDVDEFSRQPDAADERRRRADGGERDLEDDQAGRVIHQAFALQDRDDAPGQAEPLRDRGRGNGVGRGDDRAEHERRRQRQAGNHPMRDEGHDDRGRNDQPDREHENGPQVKPEIAPRGEEGLDVEQGRQEEEENQVGIER